MKPDSMLCIIIARYDINSKTFIKKNPHSEKNMKVLKIIWEGEGVE